jgi:hypothetical protein
MKFSYRILLQFTNFSAQCRSGWLNIPMWYGIAARFISRSFFPFPIYTVLSGSPEFRAPPSSVGLLRQFHDLLKL